MIRKRVGLESLETSSPERLSSPRKRPRYSFPQTPAASGSFASSSRLAASSSSSPGKFLETPRTPYTPYPLRASDSPSNPFGRKRKERLLQTLPDVTSFKRHIPLRFQFVRRDIYARQGGVFRVVRVPMNYTFAHLRCLIAWLFETPAHYANGKNGLGDAEDYLFEVKNKAKLYSPLYKPGQLKGGVTTVKLSNVRDPGRWRSGYGNGMEEDELSESEDEEMPDGESQADVEEVDCTWVDEEDYTLAHAWQKGLDPTTGIVYHHSHSTQVHITVNNLVKVPILRGSSNTPEVLTARGRVHLSTPPLPRPKFTRSVLDTFSSSPAPVPLPKSKAPPTRRSVQVKSPTPPPRFAPRSKLKLKSPPPPVKEKDLSDTDADGDTDQQEDSPRAFDSTHPFFNPIRSPSKNRQKDPEVILVEDSDEESAEDAHEIDDDNDDDSSTGEDIDKVLRVERWNTPKYVFGLYLLRFMDPLGGPYNDIDASFFEKKKVYDPFEYDNDPIIEPKKRRVEEAYEEDIGEEEEEEEEEEEGEEGSDIDEDADEEDAEVEDENDEEEEIDEDGYDEEEAIQHDPPTQKPPLESEYTPDLTTNCASPSSSLPPSSPGPGLGILSSPSLYSNSFANSSSHSLFGGSAYSDYEPHSDSIIILEEHYPNKKYTYTPAPPKKRKHRLRIKRLEKKLANIKKSDFLCRNDEVEEEKPAKEEEEEVDQLAESEKAADEDDGVDGVKPVLGKGEVWDPFGDEPEI